MSSFIIAGYLWRILGRGPKTPPYPWAALKKPILNRVKAGKNANNETDFYYDAIFNFRKFYRDFGKFKKTTSLDSKLSELIDFYKLFKDFKDFVPPSDDTKERKNKVMNRTHQPYTKYFNT